jgi:transcriptional regulator with XRE-family HTH domain
MSQGSALRNQRKPKIPPHVKLKAVRQRLGFSLEDVAKGMSARTGLSHNKGTISAIENGVRGVSPEFLEHLEAIYGLAPDSITTNYVPQPRRTRRDA